MGRLANQLQGSIENKLSPTSIGTQPPASSPVLTPNATLPYPSYGAGGRLARQLAGQQSSSSLGKPQPPDLSKDIGVNRGELATDLFLKAPAKFVGSALAVPADLTITALNAATGKNVPFVQNTIPGVGQTYQAENQRETNDTYQKALIANDALERTQNPPKTPFDINAPANVSGLPMNKSMPQSTRAQITPEEGVYLGAVVKPFYQVPLAGLQTLGLVNTAQEGVNAVQSARAENFLQAHPENQQKIGEFIKQSTTDWAKEGGQTILPKLQASGQPLPENVINRAVDDVIGKIGLPVEHGGFGYENTGGLRQYVQAAMRGKTYTDIGALQDDLTNILEPALQGKTPAGIADAVQKTAPVLDKADKIRTMTQSGLRGGAVEKGNVFPTLTRQPTMRDLEVAHDATPFVQSNSPVKNIQNVSGEIGRIANDELTPFLKANPGENFHQHFVDRLISVQPPDIVKGDQALLNQYELVRQKALEVAARYPDTSLGGWQARQELDNVIEKNFGDAIWDPTNKYHTPVKEGLLAAREAFNEAVVDSLGPVGEQYSSAMRQMNNLYIARQNMAEQAFKDLGMNGILRYFKYHPVQKAIGEIVAGGAAARVGYKYLTGK